MSAPSVYRTSLVGVTPGPLFTPVPLDSQGTTFTWKSNHVYDGTDPKNPTETGQVSHVAQVKPVSGFDALVEAEGFNPTITSGGVFDVTVNHSPVITTDSLGGTQGSDGYYTSPVTVTLTATDMRSGVASTTYTVDGGPQQSYTGPFVVSGDGTHTITFFSTDNAGNVEPSQSDSFQIDTTPPHTVIDSGPSSRTNSTSAVFTFHGTDALSGVAGFEYRLDGGAWTATVSSSLTLTGLANGSHTLLVEAVDAAGNVDPTPPSYSWTVGTMAPRITDVKVHWGTAGVASLSTVSGRDLPWLGINQIEVDFSEDVAVSRSDLALSGLAVPSYGIAGFSYDAATHAAIWTLSSKLGIDHLSLALDGPNDIHDRAGNLLLGGPATQTFNVLPGDFNGDGVVNSSDLVFLRNNFTASHPYYALYDLNGDGGVDLADYTLLRTLLGTHL
jgi:hypothetical protein